MIDLGNSTKCYKVTFFSKLENWHAVGGHCTDFTKFSWIFDLSSVLITFVFGNLLSQIEKCIFSGSFGFIHKDIFACLFSIHNTISLSCHEQVCLSGRLKHTCSWHDKLIVFWLYVQTMSSYHNSTAFCKKLTGTDLGCSSDEDE